jgi:hypothetical protein
MFENIVLLITALSAVSREIREWVKMLNTREKDDESHPPFLIISILPSGTTFYT